MKATIFLLISLLAVYSCPVQAEELQIETVKNGDCSRKAKKGDEVLMHYEGKLTDGSEFDSSYKRGDPLKFVLGTGAVIKGWDQGLDGICVGEIRNLVIPHDLAYGESGYPPVIPARATLKFKVELVGFGNASADEEL